MRVLKEGLLSLGLVVALLVTEFATRVFNLYEFPTDDFVEPHPELEWSHVLDKEGKLGNSAHVKINSKGLRDTEYSYEKEEGTFRILVLGDSFTEGLQVPLEDTFCKVLEYEFNKTQRHFEVIYAGFAGVGTDYELLSFRREGHQYHPDLVMVAFFPNDICDNYRSRQVLDDKSTPLEYEKKGLIIYLKHFLAQNSYVYSYFGLALPKHAPSLANLLMKLGLLLHQPIDHVQDVDQRHYLVFEKQYGGRIEKGVECDADSDFGTKKRS